MSVCWLCVGVEVSDQGCFLDDLQNPDIEDVVTTFANNTIETCINYCDSQFYHYASVEVRMFYLLPSTTIHLPSSALLTWFSLECMNGHLSHEMIAYRAVTVSFQTSREFLNDILRAGQRQREAFTQRHTERHTRRLRDAETVAHKHTKRQTDIQTGAQTRPLAA